MHYVTKNTQKPCEPSTAEVSKTATGNGCSVQFAGGTAAEMRQPCKWLKHRPLKCLAGGLVMAKEVRAEKGSCLLGLSPAYTALSLTLSSEAEATLPGHGAQWLTQLHHGSCLEVPPSHQGPVRPGDRNLGERGGGRTVGRAWLYHLLPSHYKGKSSTTL